MGRIKIGGGLKEGEGGPPRRCFPSPLPCLRVLPLPINQMGGHGIREIVDALVALDGEGGKEEWREGEKNGGQEEGRLPSGVYLKRLYL